jgi:regulator of PEP synthase PpsR (kinase-PPPase family)
MISDATGETLVAIAKAVRVQYPQVRAIEHIHPLVRHRRELERVLKDVEATPGIVLYTVVNPEFAEELEQSCKRLKLPCVPALQTVLKVFESYLGMPSTPRVAGQHVLDAEYFQRIEALNFTMMHDDGHLPENLDDADILLVGISRTSKTPTSIYLANRGVKTANVPLVPGVQLSPGIERLKHPLIVGLYASPERVVQIRQNRLLSLKAHRDDDKYIDREAVAEEIAASRRLCGRHNWPLIDVTRRSIEETAAAILALLGERRRHMAS